MDDICFRHRPMTESAHTSFGVGRLCFVSCCMVLVVGGLQGDGVVLVVAMIMVVTHGVAKSMISRVMCDGGACSCWGHLSSFSAYHNSVILWRANKHHASVARRLKSNSGFQWNPEKTIRKSCSLPESTGHHCLRHHLLQMAGKRIRVGRERRLTTTSQ